MLNNDLLEVVRYKYLNDYLFFSDRLDEDFIDMETLLKSDTFKDYFKMHLKFISKELLSYPMEVMPNIKEIMKYVLKSHDDEALVNELMSYYSNIHKYSNDFYSNQLYTKKNRYKDYMNKNIKWDDKEFIKSLRYDYITAMSFSAQNENYVVIYLRELILNRNYVMSLKRLLKEFPDLFDDQNIERRTLSILDTNVDLLSSYDYDAVSQYVRVNKEVRKEAYKIELSELKDFKDECADLINRICKKKASGFNMKVMNSYKDNLKIEKYLNDGGEIEISYEGLKRQIDQRLKEFWSDESHKKTFLDLLDGKKQEMIAQLKGNEKNEFLKEYNNYLIKFNMSDVDKDKNMTNELIKRTSEKEIIKESLKSIFTKNYKKLNTILESSKYDLELFLLYFLSDKDFKKEIEKYKDNCELHYSINRFYKDVKELFDDEILKSRTLELLELDNSKGSKKVKRKIKGE